MPLTSGIEDEDENNDWRPQRRLAPTKTSSADNDVTSTTSSAWRSEDENKDEQRDGAENEYQTEDDGGGDNDDTDDNDNDDDVHENDDDVYDKDDKDDTTPATRRHRPVQRCLSSVETAKALEVAWEGSSQNENKYF